MLLAKIFTDLNYYLRRGKKEWRGFGGEGERNFLPFGRKSTCCPVLQDWSCQGGVSKTYEGGTADCGSC